jgi:hypothetical protein
VPDASRECRLARHDRRRLAAASAVRFRGGIARVGALARPWVPQPAWRLAYTLGVCLSLWVSQPYMPRIRVAFSTCRPPTHLPITASSNWTNVRIGTMIVTIRTRLLGCQASSAAIKKRSASGNVRMKPRMRCGSSVVEPPQTAVLQVSES